LQFEIGLSVDVSVKEPSVVDPPSAPPSPASGIETLTPPQATKTKQASTRMTMSVSRVDVL
jgi:hypothetical protein